MVYSAPMSGDQYDPESYKQDQQYLDTAIEEEERRRQEQALLEQQRQQEEERIKATTDPKTGAPLPSQQTMDPKEFGLKENATELGNAAIGGLQDVANSVAGLPQKIFDPRFYQTDNGEYKPAWLPFSEPPITRTVWGGFIRRAVEFGGLAFLTRKAAGRLPGAPAKYIAQGPKITPAATTAGKAANLGQNLLHSAAVGAIADASSNSSTQTTMIEDLRKVKPEWSDALEAFSPPENASPLQRTIYNMAEGLGIGPVADLLFEGAQGAIKKVINKPRSLPVDTSEAAARIVREDVNLGMEAARQSALRKQDLEITRAASQQAERDYAKNPVDNKRYADMTDQEKFNLKVKVATRQKRTSWLDQYTVYDPERRARVQADNETEVAMKRLQDEFDDPNKPQEFDGYINEGGDPSQGRAFSNTNSAMNTVADVQRIKTDWEQSKGSPRSPLTEVEYERITSVPGGVKSIPQEALDRLNNDPAYKELISELSKNGQRPSDFFTEIYEETTQLLAGRKVYELSDTELEEIYGGNVLVGANPDTTQNIAYYRIDDHLKTNVLLSLLDREMRDLALASKSVIDEVDVLAKDGLYDRLEKRWLTFHMGLKQSRYLRSLGLSELKIKPTDVEARLNEIKASVQEGASMVREALDSDKTDDLLRVITDAYSMTDSIQGWDDLDNFMRNRLRGYKDGDVQVQGMRAKELGATMVHSVLSGPKTPARALLGNTLITTLRPVQTALGATGSYLRGDDRVMRTAFAQVHAIQEALGESWKLFRLNLQSNFKGNELPDLQTIATSYTTSVDDAEFEMVKAWVDSNRGESERALFNQVAMLRGLNKNPLLTWSSKVMAATDVAFQHITGRMRLKEVAINKAFDYAQAKNLTLDDTAMRDLVQEYEKQLHGQIFEPDGTLSDALAQRNFRETAMTQDMPKMLQNLDNALAMSPWLKPFMLFTRTSWNALTLTGKHTPILNRHIKEIRDITSLPSGHPDLVKYGINNDAEHAAAKSLIKGREAMATSVVTMAGLYYASGNLTGNGPSDKQLRETWQQMGWQPRSMRIAGQWVSYDSLEPFNMFLSFVADVGDVSKEMGPEWQSKMMDRAKYLLVANIVNKSFMQGLSQLTEALTAQSAGEVSRVVASMINNQAPLSSLRNDIGKLFNPGMRELSAEFTDSIANRNLWAGELADLPYKRDLLNGSPLKMFDFPTRMWNTVMPFQINLDTTPTRELLFRSLYDVKTTVNTLPGQGGGQLPPRLKSKFQAFIGQQNIEAQLNQLFARPQIIESILKMESDRNSGERDIDPMSYMHNQEINAIFQNAKQNAWVAMQNDAQVAPMIRAQMNRVAVDNMRKQGQFTQADAYREILEPSFGK
jgi:hypothetical protein